MRKIFLAFLFLLGIVNSFQQVFCKEITVIIEVFHSPSEPKKFYVRIKIDDEKTVADLIHQIKKKLDIKTTFHLFLKNKRGYAGERLEDNDKLSKYKDYISRNLLFGGVTPSFTRKTVFGKLGGESINALVYVSPHETIEDLNYKLNAFFSTSTMKAAKKGKKIIVALLGTTPLEIKSVTINGKKTSLKKTDGVSKLGERRKIEVEYQQQLPKKIGILLELPDKKLTKILTLPETLSIAQLKEKIYKDFLESPTSYKARDLEISYNKIFLEATKTLKYHQIKTNNILEVVLPSIKLSIDSHSYTVTENIPIKELKNQIIDDRGEEFEHYDLYLGKTKLDENKPLSNYDINPGMVNNLVLKKKKINVTTKFGDKSMTTSLDFDTPVSTLIKIFTDKDTALKNYDFYFDNTKLNESKTLLEQDIKPETNPRFDLKKKKVVVTIKSGKQSKQVTLDFDAPVHTLIAKSLNENIIEKQEFDLKYYDFYIGDTKLVDNKTFLDLGIKPETINNFNLKKKQVSVTVNYNKKVEVFSVDFDASVETLKNKIIKKMGKQFVNCDLFLSLSKEKLKENFQFHKLGEKLEGATIELDLKKKQYNVSVEHKKGETFDIYLDFDATIKDLKKIIENKEKQFKNYDLYKKGKEPTFAFLERKDEKAGEEDALSKYSHTVSYRGIYSKEIYPFILKKKKVGVTIKSGEQSKQVTLDFDASVKQLRDKIIRDKIIKNLKHEFEFYDLYSGKTKLDENKPLSDYGITPGMVNNLDLKKKKVIVTIKFDNESKQISLDFDTNAAQLKEKILKEVGEKFRNHLIHSSKGFDLSKYDTTPGASPTFRLEEKPKVEEKKITIFVQSPTSKTYTFEVKNNITVNDLKSKIEESTKIESKYISLVFSGNNLDDKDLLSDYSIQDNSTVHFNFVFDEETSEEEEQPMPVTPQEPPLPSKKITPQIPVQEPAPITAPQPVTIPEPPAPPQQLTEPVIPMPVTPQEPPLPPKTPQIPVLEPAPITAPQPVTIPPLITPLQPVVSPLPLTKKPEKTPPAPPITIPEAAKKTQQITITLSTKKKKTIQLSPDATIADLRKELGIGLRQIIRIVKPDKTSIEIQDDYKISNIQKQLKQGTLTVEKSPIARHHVSRKPWWLLLPAAGAIGTLSFTQARTRYYALHYQAEMLRRFFKEKLAIPRDKAITDDELLEKAEKQDVKGAARLLIIKQQMEKMRRMMYASAAAAIISFAGTGWYVYKK